MSLVEASPILDQVVRGVFQARFFDEKAFILSKQNKGGNFHLANKGHEIVGVSAGVVFSDPKYMGFPYYRDRGFAIGKGANLVELFATCMARSVKTHSGGRMMPDHYSDEKVGLALQSSVVGSQLLQAVGYALGVSLRGEDGGAYVSIGDGGTSQGDFHEALNFAALYALPVVFVVQDNGWAISVPKEEQTAGGDIAKIAAGYSGLEVQTIDGTNIEEAIHVFERAKERLGEGPTLVVAKVPRIGPHSSSDDPKKYKDDCEERDPLEGLSLSDEELISISEEVEEAAESALKVPFAESVEDQDAFAPFEGREIVREGHGEKVTMATCLNHALEEEMALDERVIVFGQDVAHGKGGVFCITERLTEKFGKERCFNTPLAESTIIGLALGLAINERFKPVAEIQFSDYMWTGVNQLFNEVASYYFRGNGMWRLPLVIRMPCGGYIQGGPYHSQSVEAFLSHVPGLKVVLPSNAEDAKRLFKTAIEDPNPVVFLEHKALYRQAVFSSRSEPTSEERIPFGKAKVVIPGDDVTVVTWGMGVLMAKQAVEETGVSAEVIDLRTINPWDKESVLASVKKNSKVLILHEAPRNCGFGAEVAAVIAEEAFNDLDAPVMRIGGLNLPVPFAKNLEEIVLPSLDKVKEELIKLATY